jgi:hypothetical protein
LRREHHRNGAIGHGHDDNEPLVRLISAAFCAILD